MVLVRAWRDYQSLTTPSMSHGQWNRREHLVRLHFTLETTPDSIARNEGELTREAASQG